jgi:hypothetical protein
VRSDNSEQELPDQSVLGEEDPGAAMDVAYKELEPGIPVLELVPLNIENSETPLLTATETAVLAASSKG